MDAFGSRVFYDKETGKVLQKTAQGKGKVKQPSVQSELNRYKVLSKRDKESIDYIQLEYGEYNEDFDLADEVFFDTKLKKLSFNYNDE